MYKGECKLGRGECLGGKRRSDVPDINADIDTDDIGPVLEVKAASDDKNEKKIKVSTVWFVVKSAF